MAFPLYASTDYPKLLANMLVARGIRDVHEAKIFFAPSLRHLHSPRLFKDMDCAVSRILRAIKENERVVIWSDYDTDGIPAGVILHDFFKKIGFKNFTNYIPHRHEEGFGLNEEAIELLAQEGTQLIVTLDCGISGVSEVARAKKLGIDVVITGHHLPAGNADMPNGSLPDAYAIVNPKQKGDCYPNKDICAGGIAYKLAEALLSMGNFSVESDWLENLLDMVGIATLSDMVPLRGENRALAYFGLRSLRRSRRVGLRALIKEIGITQELLTEDDVVFSIAPRLNAASRMDHPEHAFVLLSTDDVSEAIRAAKLLSKLNDERKGVVAAMVKEVHKKVSDMNILPPVIVLGNTSWKPGLLGLAANVVVETYGRPAFLWGREGSQNIKGSCRSDGSVNVVELMKSAEDSFLEYGGHALSGGFSVSGERVHFLPEVLNKNLSNVEVLQQDESPSAYLDLTLDEIDWYIYSIIESLSPFGVGNEKPKFRFAGVIPDTVRIFGKEDNHTELLFYGDKKISAISFFKKPQSFKNVPIVGKPIDLIATIERSFFKGTPELRLRIVDIL